MACPNWTKSLNQPLDILDALKVIKWSIDNKELVTNHLNWRKRSNYLYGFIKIDQKRK